MRHVTVAVLVAVSMLAWDTSYADTRAPYFSGESWWVSQGNNQGGHTSDMLKYGWDFNWGTGSQDLNKPVVASRSGRIVVVYNDNGYNDGWGNTVVSQSDEGGYERVAHLNTVFVQLQEYVEQGQVLGLMGSTGKSTAPHLHFQHQDTEDGNSSAMTFTDIGSAAGCNCNDNLGWNEYTSQNSNIIDLRKEATLNNRNPYAWPETPDEAFGDAASPQGALYEIGWYHEKDPSNFYNTDGTATDCYRAIYSGSTYGAAIVYDALGGARHAYVVGWEKWQIWDQLSTDMNGYSCPTGACYQSTLCDGASGEGGPNSVLGMPITNSYETALNSDDWRQDFQKGYIQNGTIYCYSNCSPGWVSGETWNNQYSYLFADAYDRNGASRDVGEAQNRVHVLSNDILIQEFSGGNDGFGMIMYDMMNWECNPSATNEAYWVYGNIKTNYDSKGGVDVFGCATIDRFYYNGKWCQDFKNAYGTQWRIFADGNLNPIIIGTCEGGIYTAVGGGEVAYPDAVIVRRKNATTYKWRACPSDGFSSFGTVMDVKDDFGHDGMTYYMADLNHDGYDDALSKQALNSGNVVRWRAALADGNGNLGEQSIWYDDLGQNSQKFLIGDFNGDGKADIAHSVIRAETKIGWYVATSTGITFNTQVDWKYHLGYDGDQFFAGDFNGDGKDDILIRREIDANTVQIRVGASTGSSFHNGAEWLADFGAPGQKLWIGDFNGDGKDDIAHEQAVSNTSVRWWVSLSTGSSFEPQSLWIADFGDKYNCRWFSRRDMDGDGCCDMVVAKHDASNPDIIQWRVAKSNGIDAFVDNRIWKSDFDDDGDWTMIGNIAPNSSYSAKIQTQPDGDVVIPSTFSLRQNYPNPFNPTTVIEYSLPEAAHVRIDVYNILGQKVETVVDEQQTAGEHTASWNASRQASGVYFYRIQAGNAIETKKMVLLK